MNWYRMFWLGRFARRFMLRMNDDTIDHVFLVIALLLIATLAVCVVFAIPLTRLGGY